MSETPRYILCPYCGHPQPLGDQCNACGGLFEPLSRKATQITMGPWYIRDRNSPFRPGCSFEILKKQINAGRVKANTVLRGPTTHQFWSVARNTPGVSHLLGYCHDCNASVKPTDNTCPKCDTAFKLPTKRNELGLLYPNDAAAEKAQQSLDREINKIFGPGKNQSKTSSSSKSSSQTQDQDQGTRAPVQGGIDLLDQVLNTGSSKPTSRQPSASGQSAKPAPLDFTPSPDSPADAAAARQAGEAGKPNNAPLEQEPHPTTEVPSAGGSNAWLIWVLLASNVIVVGLLAAAVWLLKQPQS